MPKMRALRSHGWNGVMVQKGAEYDATEQETKLLMALGWAAVVSAPTYQRRDMTVLSRTDPAHRRNYARRDLGAES